MPVSPESAAEDIALMRAVKRGDTAAFTTLVERWQQPIVNFLHRMLPDQEEAEDLAQSVFVQLWRTADRYEPAARFSTFLFTIARNLCLNEIRRRSRHPAERMDATSTDEEGEEMCRQYRDRAQQPADAEAERSELFAKVDEAVADLPEKQRVALSLCRDGELSYEEIAEVVQLSVAATKSLIFRAREVLRSRLKAYLGDGSWTANPVSPDRPAAAANNDRPDNFSGSPGDEKYQSSMNNLNSPDPDDSSDWLDAIAAGRPTSPEIAARRRELTGRSAELRRLEEELALNALLDARPKATRVSTNFAARVLDQIAREDGQKLRSRDASQSSRWHRWFIAKPIWALGAVTVMGAAIGWEAINQHRRSQMVATVATVALTTSAPGLSAESLEDYEIIRRLGTQAQPGDDALIAALVETSVP